MQYLQWFITPRHLPDDFIGREKAYYVIIYTFILLIITTINISVLALIAYVNTFTLFTWIISIICYGLARYVNYRIVASTMILSLLAMPYLLLAINPSYTLPILTLLFLITISLLMTSVFLSLRSTIFIAICALISNLALNSSSLLDTDLTTLTVLVPSFIIIFLLLMNAYGRERLANYIRQGTNPRDPAFFNYALNLMLEPTVIHVGVTIVAVNNSAALLLGETKDALIGQSITDFTMPDDANVYETDIHAEQLTIHYQGMLKQADPKQPLSITARSINYADTLATLMTLRPIASQTLAALDDTQAVFADENEKIFQYFAYNMADYTYSISFNDAQEQQFDWVIGKIDTILGRSESEILQFPDWSTVIHPDDLAFYKLRLKSTLSGETRTLEYRITQPDGTVRWMQDTAYPIVNMQTGTVYRILSAVNDVTDRMRSQENLKAHVIQQAIVAELGILALSTTDYQNMIQHVIVLCEQVLNDSSIVIFEYNAPAHQLTCINRSIPESALHFDDTIIDHQSLAAYTLHAKEPVISNDLACEKRFTALPYTLEQGYASGVGVIILGNDNPFGILTVYSKLKQAFTHNEVYFLQSISNVLGTFIERNRAQLVEREQAEFTDALRRATAAINAKLELPEVLSQIITYVQQVVPQSKQVSIMLLNEETQRYYHYMTWGFADDAPEKVTKYAFAIKDFPILSQMAQTQDVIYVPDVTQDDRWITRETVSQTRAYLGTPIIVDNQNIGFINLHAYYVDAFDDILLQRLKTLAETAGTAIVNARKQEYLETQILHRTAELQKQSDRISTILEGTGDGIFYTENDRIAFANDTLCKLTGYTTSEIINQSSVIFQPDDITPAELEQFRSITQIVLAGEVWRGKVRLCRKDGLTFEAGLTISLIDSPDDIIRSVTIVRDMSKESELERLKRTLIASAAHDLRSPIMSLQMRMHMIKQQPQKIDYHMERLNYIIDRMNNLVSDLLDSHGRITLKKKTLILQNLLDQVVDILAFESETKGIQFDYTSPDEPYTLLADKHRLEQVFFNLITNAINYTDTGGKITISYHIHQAKNSVMIDIADTGVGIPEDELENIFLPFYRTKDNDRKGNGLGLSITHEIVTLHGGTITVVSVKGKGSTFTVELPLHALASQ